MYEMFGVLSGTGTDLPSYPWGQFGAKVAVSERYKFILNKQLLEKS